MNWAGENPLYMVVQTLTDIEVIDLDERGWKTTYEDVLHMPGMRTLLRKDTNDVVVERFCRDDETVTYNSKVIGYFGGPQIRAYGFDVVTPEGYTMMYWAPWVNRIFYSGEELMASASQQLASLSVGPSDIVIPDE